MAKTTIFNLNKDFTKTISCLKTTIFNMSKYFTKTISWLD